MQDAWFRRVVLSLLIDYGCILGIACNKSISVSSLISFKNQVRIAIMMTDLSGSSKECFSAEKMNLLVREVKACEQTSCSNSRIPPIIKE